MLPPSPIRNCRDINISALNLATTSFVVKCLIVVVDDRRSGARYRRVNDGVLGISHTDGTPRRINRAANRTLPSHPWLNGYVQIHYLLSLLSMSSAVRSPTIYPSA